MPTSMPSGNNGRVSTRAPWGSSSEWVVVETVIEGVFLGLGRPTLPVACRARPFWLGGSHVPGSRVGACFSGGTCLVEFPGSQRMQDCRVQVRGISHGYMFPASGQPGSGGNVGGGSGRRYGFGKLPGVPGAGLSHLVRNSCIAALSML